MIGKFEIFPVRNSFGRMTYWWRLKSRNGRKLAGSLEGFSSISNARRALITAHNVGEYAKIEVVVK